MTNFSNTPRNTNIPEGKKIQYTHQPLTIDHFGTHVKIQENGKVVISKVSEDQSDAEDGEIIYDDISVSASLIFKIASALKMTRSETLVDIGSTTQKEELV